MITLKLVGHNVRATCPDCETVTTFEYKSADKGGEHGSVVIQTIHTYDRRTFDRAIYRLLQCAGCGRGGLAKIHSGSNPDTLESFLPMSLERALIPPKVPDGIKTEFREAELCAAVGAYRAASALLRSVLEKTLNANGYTKGKLEQKIDQAADDGIITVPRKKLAHENVRVLGNDVLHDEWREVEPGEVERSHWYAQRILEDFYDDRDTVEEMLRQKGRLPQLPASPVTEQKTNAYP